MNLKNLFKTHKFASQANKVTANPVKTLPAEFGLGWTLNHYWKAKSYFTTEPGQT